MDTTLRTLVKAILWQLLGFAFMALTAWIFTGSMAEGGAIAVTATVLGFVSYFLYERLWSRVHWGRIDVRSSPDPVSTTLGAPSSSDVRDAAPVAVLRRGRKTRDGDEVHTRSSSSTPHTAVNVPAPPNSSATTTNTGERLGA